MRGLQAIVATCCLGASSWQVVEAQPVPGSSDPSTQAARASAGNAPAAPCRTTALATMPQLFTENSALTGALQSGNRGGAIGLPVAEYLERFLVAVECDDQHTPGDYQIWWKPSMASPPSSARLVAILNEQTETCGLVLGCFPAGPKFDFAVEVNRWRMTEGCYGVRGIYGAAIDDYWQCTRSVVFTLEKDDPPQR